MPSAESESVFRGQLEANHIMGAIPEVQSKGQVSPTTVVSPSPLRHPPLRRSHPSSGQVDPFGQEQKWLQAFEAKHGRPLRVLHIGNIANNAYNNAKIQRERGIDADVLSFDYYHIMACPEWEDSDFSGDVGDEYFPDWWSVDLKGFRRPRWFVAGPLDACIRYLLAKTGDRRSTDWLWRELAFERWVLSHRGKMRDWVVAAIRKFAGRPVLASTNPVNALMMASVGQKMRVISNVWLFSKTSFGRRLKWRAERLVRFSKTAHLADDAGRHMRMMRRNVVAVRTRSKHLLGEVGVEEHPDDLEFFYQWWWHPYLFKLFSRYDVIQAYATYTALPFIAGLKKYVAYEHGTIRSIPFQDTREGRMCMATYRAASSVLVTNLDNLAAAEKMQIDLNRVTCLPHAFDSNKLLQFARNADIPQPFTDRIVTFFTSARQHWVDGDPGWAKGNDRVFAALRLIKDRGHNCLLRATAWGNDLEASRNRVSELGIDDMVEWLPTLKKRELWREYLQVHAVIDQFAVPGFGGVTFEAMMLGRRVLTNVDKILAQRFFGAAPPLFSCETADQIAEAMLLVIADPGDHAGYGLANQEWMQSYHSADRIVSLQTQVYRQLIEDEAVDVVHRCDF